MVHVKNPPCNQQQTPLQNRALEKEIPKLEIIFRAAMLLVSERGKVAPEVDQPKIYGWKLPSFPLPPRNLDTPRNHHFGALQP